MQLVNLAIRNVFRNARRTLITMSAIGCGLSLVLMMVGLQAGQYADNATPDTAFKQRIDNVHQGCGAGGRIAQNLNARCIQSEMGPDAADDPSEQAACPATAAKP